jgi:uncharacterized protein
MFAQRFIDNLDFARKHLALRGEIAVAELPRLQDALAASVGVVAYAIQGLTGKNGQPVLRVSLDGACQLRCQRCLQGLPYRIAMTALLAPVAAEALADDVPDEDGMERIPAEARMDVLELIEEEILLGLPLAPRHEVGMCNVER